MPGSRRLVMAIAVSVFVAACAGSASPPAPTPSPSPFPAPLFVRLDEFDVAVGEVKVTHAEFLTGDAATKAAQEAGDPWGAPNGFYIRLLLTTDSIPIDPAARITVNGHDANGDWSPVPISVAEFVAALGGGRMPESMDSSPYWWIQVAGGRIVALDQVQLP